MHSDIMNDKMNKTSICSIVALDIIDYSKKTGAEQIEIKKQLDNLIDLAVIDIPESDRVIVDMEQGAVVACSGPLEDALEDALFISLTIRDEILKNNAHSLKPLYVQFGINLGSAQLTNKKGEPDIIGEGVEEAKRIMSFANPNQILVSRVYHEMSSKLTQEISNMFEQYDMHALEQEIYAVRPLKDQATASDSADVSSDDAGTGKLQLFTTKFNWTYAVAGLLVLTGFFALGKALLNPTEPTITMDPPVVAEVSKKLDSKPKDEPLNNAKPVQAVESEQSAEPTQTAEPSKAEEAARADQPANTVQDEPKKTIVVKKKVTQKALAETKVTPSKVPASITESPAVSHAEKPAPSAGESHSPASVAVKPTESKTEKNATHDKSKSGWQTFKDSVTSGSERKCTQAEIAMNQCNK